MKAVLVTGSRYWADPKPIREALEAEAPDLVVEGGAKGADSHAREWARLHGLGLLTWPDEHWGGHLSGPARNGCMVSAIDAFKAAGWEVAILAFPGPRSRGTWSCVRQAQDARLAVTIFSQEADIKLMGDRL